MRKHYIFLLFAVFLANETLAQFTKYPNEVLFNWASPYKSYTYEGQHFRIKYPNGFDSLGVQKYPVILFFHGFGERGTDNENQLKHGGQRTLNAINSGEFPGMAVYPQTTGVSWDGGNITSVVNLLEELIEKCNADPDRIYIHGLSLGAEGVWRFAFQYPQYTAAIFPMSGVVGGNNAGVTRFIPTWLSQGGLDNNPTPFTGNSRVISWRQQGANIRYSYMPTTGHGTWNAQYSKSEFFSWFLEKHKTDITVLYGQSSFCEGDPIDVTLGLTPGFADYQWVKNDTTSINFIASGSGSNTITVSDVGNYYVRFKRSNNVWSRWSKSVNINRDLEGAPVVETSVGKQSLNLPTIAGQQSVQIAGPQGLDSYRWFRNATIIADANNFNYTTSTSGTYALSVRTDQVSGWQDEAETIPSEFQAAPQPCFSDPSEPLIVTTENGLNVPAKPTSFSANLLNDNSIVINWNDNSADELAFELYRSLQSGSGYSFLSRIDATNGSNPQSYIDIPLSANTTYFYRMRAVNNSGGSDYTAEVSASTLVDNESPSAPVLNLIGSSTNSVSLEWTSSIDNIAVVGYDVFRNGALVASLPNDQFQFTNTGLAIDQTYSYVVRAKDEIGNISLPSNQVTAKTSVSQGLKYTYYHHNNFNSVDQIIGNSTIVKTGIINNFDISVRERADRFAFIYEGLVEIPNGGDYTFYTSSDDGSKLYINNELVVDNDGTHGCQERNGTLTLPAGLAGIRVLMFENGGGECLQVRWRGPGINKQFIPDNRLFNNSFELSGFPVQPSGLQASVISNKQTDLSWADNSNNENNFEIYRSLNQNSNFQLVHLAAANAISWSDTELVGGTTYYYKIKAINLNGSSVFDGPVSATTVANPPAPAAPTGLTLQIENSSSVRLNWVDVATTELGYEIYRSTSTELATFTLIKTTGPDISTYLDEQTGGNSTYFYRLRAKGDGNFSSYTPVLNITTDNNPPIIEAIIDRSVKYGTTLELPIIVNDPDGDPITFSFLNPLPSFMSLSDNGYGTAQLTIISDLSNEGQYPIEVTANDGSGGTDTESFIVTISDNENPDVAPISNVTITEGLSQIVNVDASDETMETLTLSASNLPEFVDFIDNGFGSGTFAINPEINQNGVYNNLKLLASDGNGGFSEVTFNINVNVARRNFSVLVNFGGIIAPSPWNTVRGASTDGKINKLLTSNDGSSLDIRFDSSNPRQWYNNEGVSQINSELYIDEVSSSYARSTFGNANFELRELNPSLSYDLTFYAGALNTSFANTRISINGVVQTLNPNNNTDNTIVFTNQKSDGNGDIFILVNGTPNNNYILNSMVVDVYYEDGLPPSSPTNLTLNAVSNSEVSLAWQDNSNNEQRFEIYRSDVSETGPFAEVGSVLLNQTTFNDENLSGNTTYYYKVRAVNSTGNAESSIAFITTQNSAPVLAAVQDIVMSAGDTLEIPLSANDAEGDAIVIENVSLPAFAQLIDNEDGTGTLFLIPTTSEAGFYGNNIIEASDVFGLSNQLSFNIQVVDNLFVNTVYLNLGNNSNATPPWNNLSGSINEGTTYNILQDFIGQPSGISMEVGAGWSSSAADGMNSGNNGFLFEDAVFQNYWRSDNATASLTISGLDPAKIYTFEILGSSNQWLNTETNYTIQGKTRTKIDVTKNSSNLLSFSGILPNQQGEVSFTLSRFNQYTEAMFLNAIVVKEMMVGQTPLSPSKFEVESVSKSEIELSWQDNSVNESGYEIYVTDEIGKAFSLLTSVAADSETYLHGGLTANSARIYKVRAISGTGNSAFTPEKAAVTINNKIYVNFNTDISDYLQAGSPWNNTNKVPTTGLIVDNLVDFESNPIPMQLSIEDIGDGSNNKNGPVTGNSIYPDAVMQAYYYFEPNAAPGLFKLSNLADDMAYDLTFLGSHGNNLFVITDYTVGDETVTVFGKNNRSRTGTIYDVIPDAENSILFEVDASNENQALYGFMNSLVIEEHRSAEVALDKIAPSIPNNLVANNVTENTLDLLWNTATDNVSLGGYEVYKNGEMIAYTTEAILSVEGLVPDYEYIFTVRSVDRNSNKSQFSDDLIINTSEPTGGFTTFYSEATGDLSNLSSWNSQEDGNGSSPVNFTSINQQFILNRNTTLESEWIISGSGSRLIVSNDVTLEVDANFTGVISALENTQVMFNENVTVEFIEMHPSSTVNFNAATNNIPAASYGNLSLGGGNGANKQFSAGNITIEGTLNVIEGVTLNGVDPNSTSIVAKGTVSFHGIGNDTPSAQMLSLVMAGAGEQHIETFDDNISLFALHIRQGTDVVFDSNNSEMQLSVGNESGGGLVIDNGATLNIGSHKLVVGGRGTVNSQNQVGKVKSNNGSVEIHSTSTVTSHLYFEAGSDTISVLLADLVNLGELEINSPIYISEELQIKDGIVDAQEGHLTMISTAEGTAYISEIENRGEIQGVIKAQRYVAAPPNRLYRYFGSMVQNATVSDWQQHIAITGNFTGRSTGAGLGTDPSVFYYDENSVANWIPYPTTSNEAVMEAGKGFIVFTRNLSSPLRLELTGEPVQGDFEFDLVAAGTNNPEANDGVGDGWNLIANPYQSPIQWGTAGWSGANLSPILSIWDSDYAGGGKYFYAGEGVVDDSFDGEVAVGQGFWVQAIAANPQLTISESAKAKTNDAVYFRNSGEIPTQLTIRLAQGSKEDKAFIRYSEDGAKLYDGAIHGRKRSNSIFNISTASNDSVSLAINHLPKDFCRDSIAIVTSNLTPGNYELTFEKLETFINNEEFILIDHFTQAEVDINSDTQYNFTVADADGPSGTGRFALIIQKPELQVDKTFVSSQSVLCESELLPSITLENAQAGVKYTLWVNNVESSIEVIGRGQDLDIDLADVEFDFGINTFQLKASFGNCTVYTLNNSVTIEYLRLPQTESTVDDVKICTNERAYIEVNPTESGLLFKWYIDELSDQPIYESMNNVYATPELNVTTTYFYSVVNSNGCESSERQAVNVIVEDLDKPTISTEKGVLVSSSDEGNQWYFNGNIIEGEIGQSISVTQVGNYSVSVSNGLCTVFSDEFKYVINSSSDIDNLNFTLYPNPVVNDFYIVYSQNLDEDVKVNILDLTGRQVHSSTFRRGTNKHSVSINGLASGTYIVQIVYHKKPFINRLVVN